MIRECLKVCLLKKKSHEEQKQKNTLRTQQKFNENMNYILLQIRNVLQNFFPHKFSYVLNVRTRWFD